MTPCNRHELSLTDLVQVSWNRFQGAYSQESSKLCQFQGVTQAKTTRSVQQVIPISGH